MGLRIQDYAPIQDALRKCMAEIRSPYNDGFTSSYCKHELYKLKCWLDDEYKSLPTFVGEDTWEQERVVEILKR